MFQFYEGKKLNKKIVLGRPLTQFELTLILLQGLCSNPAPSWGGIYLYIFKKHVLSISAGDYLKDLVTHDRMFNHICCCYSSI